MHMSAPSLPCPLNQPHQPTNPPTNPTLLLTAGDTMDDANFAIDTANAAILALFVEEAWVQEMLQAK